MRFFPDGAESRFLRDRLRVGPAIAAPLDRTSRYRRQPDVGLVDAARDGMLRRSDATTLAPIGEPVRVPLFIANPDTCLPSVGVARRRFGDQGAVRARRRGRKSGRP